MSKNQAKLVDNTGRDLVPEEKFAGDLTEFGIAINEEIKSLQSEKVRIDKKLSDLTEQLENVNMLLKSIGSELIQTSQSKLGLLGNKGVGMPERYLQYQNVSLTQAVTDVLSNGESHNANTITEQIFEIKTREDLKRAKGSVASTLSGGNKKGLWIRVRPGVFKIKEKEQGLK